MKSIFQLSIDSTFLSSIQDTTSLSKGLKRPFEQISSSSSSIKDELTGSIKDEQPSPPKSLKQSYQESIGAFEVDDSWLTDLSNEELQIISTTSDNNQKPKKRFKVYENKHNPEPLFCLKHYAKLHIHEKNALTQWLQDSDRREPVAWIKGISGCGKSYMVDEVIKSLGMVKMTPPMYEEDDYDWNRWIKLNNLPKLKHVFVIDHVSLLDVQPKKFLSCLLKELDISGQIIPGFSNEKDDESNKKKKRKKPIISQEKRSFVPIIIITEEGYEVKSHQSFWTKIKYLNMALKPIYGYDTIKILESMYPGVAKRQLEATATNAMSNLARLRSNLEFFGVMQGDMLEGVHLYEINIWDRFKSALKYHQPYVEISEEDRERLPEKKLKELEMKQSLSQKGWEEVQQRWSHDESEFTTILYNNLFTIIDSKCKGAVSQYKWATKEFQNHVLGYIADMLQYFSHDDIFCHGELLPFMVNQIATISNGEFKVDMKAVRCYLPSIGISSTTLENEDYVTYISNLIQLSIGIPPQVKSQYTLEVLLNPVLNYYHRHGIPITPERVVRVLELYPTAQSVLKRCAYWSKEQPKPKKPRQKRKVKQVSHK